MPQNYLQFLHAGKGSIIESDNYYSVHELYVCMYVWMYVCSDCECMC